MESERVSFEFCVSSHADRAIFESGTNPIGYFSIHTKERELTEKYVLKLQALADEMLDRIKESNKMKTTEYFPILDASKAGISAKIEHPHLVGTLPKQNDFVFDVFFKMQAPFTVRFVGWPRTKTTVSF